MLAISSITEPRLLCSTICFSRPLFLVPVRCSSLHDLKIPSTAICLYLQTSAGLMRTGRIGIQRRVTNIHGPSIIHTYSTLKIFLRVMVSTSLRNVTNRNWLICKDFDQEWEIYSESLRRGYRRPPPVNDPSHQRLRDHIRVALTQDEYERLYPVRSSQEIVVDEQQERDLAFGMTLRSFSFI